MLILKTNEISRIRLSLEYSMSLGIFPREIHGHNLGFTSLAETFNIWKGNKSIVQYNVETRLDNKQELNIVKIILKEVYFYVIHIYDKLCVLFIPPPFLGIGS